MNCNEAGTLVAAFADGELNDRRRQSIETHLLDCAACAQKHASLLALRTRVRAEVSYFSAPPALRARILATLGAMRDEVPVQRRPATGRWRWLTGAAIGGSTATMATDRWGWLTGGALAGCAATMLAWVLGTTVLDWRADQELVSQAVTTHIRATLSDQLIQVASSDQHTVKPWLSARLDYSPPVRDLASEGFTLIGGRLDTLEKRPVATLVYRYRLHTIDVFVEPQLAHAPPALSTVRGFNVAHATGSGMDWLAVSDASPEVLSGFVQQLAGPATLK